MTGEQETRELLVELLREFYGRGWVSGTGGGICGPADDGGLLLAPTGVHKERVRPDEFFTVDPADGRVVRPPERRRPPPERVQRDLLRWPHRERGALERRPLARAVGGPRRRPRGRGGADHLAIRDLEMLKGIRGVTNRDVHLVPVIRNTPREPELVEQLDGRPRRPALRRSRAPSSSRDHGAYIWGDDVWEAKRHTEVYHFLFEAVGRATRPTDRRADAMSRSRRTTRPHLCPTCQQALPHARSTSSTSPRRSRRTS